MRKALILSGLLVLLTSCNQNKFTHDASGTFEATEVIVSSEASGKLESLKVNEGDLLEQGQYVGYVDSIQLHLKKEQLRSSGRAIQERRPDIDVQIASTKEQIAKAEFERNRIQRMLADNAATRKQLDDATSQIQVLQKTLNAQINSLSTSVKSLNEESNTTSVQVSQVEDQLQKNKIINPIKGTVLTKYAEEKEVVTTGKALYKIADTRSLFLRAYLVAAQLEQIKLGQPVTVYINMGEDKQKAYQGKITWISDKAEFTPKTIQTQDERQNLVYAVKIAVQNKDGLIKIGMYGDVDFK